jgi:hypothetical protein
MSFVLSYTVHKISDAQCITLLRAIGAPGTALRLPSGDLGLGDMSPGEREGVKSDHTRDTCWSENHIIFCISVTHTWCSNKYEIDTI